jgi:putative spermidine/putrescine transport system substrate-binding protein
VGKSQEDEMRTRYQMPLIVLVVLTVVTVGFAGMAWSQTLTIQTWGGLWEDGARVVGDAFAKKAGVNVRYIKQVNSREGLAMIRAHKANPQADVVYSSLEVLQDALTEGLLVPLNRSLPNIAAMPKQAVRDAWLDTSYILFGLAYRKDLVPFEIKQYEDLLDPRLKGRVASPTAMWSSGKWLIQLALVNGGSEKNIDPGFEFLKRLKPNIVTLFTGTEEPKILQAGEAVVAYTIFSGIAPLLGPSTSLAFVLPQGKPVITAVLAIAITNPKNAELAQKFVDYMATPEAQEAYCMKIVCLPPNPKAQAPAALTAIRPPQDLLYVPDVEAINKNLPAWDERFKREIQVR